MCLSYPHVEWFIIVESLRVVVVGFLNQWVNDSRVMSTMRSFVLTLEVNQCPTGLSINPLELYSRPTPISFWRRSCKGSGNYRALCRPYFENWGFVIEQHL